ncbi:NUDIX hydrolase [Brevibacillus choshinensis]|uniref:NUDIX hydrolase n=1 Tax=Brevibacillus choshinensis TaxID=54911 RepID=UPI002E20489B|nr:NUDIX hydrolase [Brevibacillus choshinensis]MED4753415.1 NUDIX hydrolase [Brevibacillus choshinensis]MED4782156.1 NUDIX hydrolase [Brevibacillus choshinensis]
MDLVFRTNEGVFNYRVAAVWIRNGRVLLHRLHSEQSWSLPGGRVAMAEDSRHSLYRELREELGIEATVGEMLWIVENFFPYNGTPYHEIGFYYRIESDDPHFPQTDGPFFSKEGPRLIFQWTPLEQLDRSELYPAFLRTALKELPAYTQHLVVRQE